jgi:hypothetical protein
MSAIFNLDAGRLVTLATKITTGTVTTVVDATDPLKGGQVAVPWFQVNENAGSTPNLTVELFDGTTSYYLGTGGVEWRAKAMSAGQSVTFSDGYIVPNGWRLRITSSDAAGKMDVIGMKTGR